MSTVVKVFVLVSMAFVGWLLWRAWRTGEVWVKGGSSDRFTRDLDMRCFAHKVSRDDSPTTYWLNVALLTLFEGLGLYLVWLR